MKINKSIVIKEAVLIVIAFTLGLIITIGVRLYSDSTVERLAEKFVRLHVLANSDRETDQKLKLKVRDAVLELLSEDMAKCRNITETKKLLTSSLGIIRETAEATIKNEGYDYKANVSLEKASFPTRTYGDYVLVAGVYQALRIEIGQAKGKNWWCVVYPPLCYVDIATNEAPYIANAAKEKLKDELSAEEYRLVAETDNPGVKVKFKAVEMWQEYKIAKEAKKNKEARETLQDSLLLERFKALTF